MSQDVCILKAICYALDQSSSLTDANYGLLQQFAVDTAREVDSLSPMSTRYSAVAFSTTTRVIQTLTPNLEGEFVPSVEGPRFFAGSTNINGGLSACFEQLKAAGTGPRVLVIATDGMNTVMGAPNPIDEIKAAGIAVVAVGIGNNIDPVALQSIATDNRFFVPAASFVDLTSLTVSSVKGACDAAQMITPTPTPSVSPSNGPVDPTPTP
eukprot:IDg16717t1